MWVCVVGMGQARRRSRATSIQPVVAGLLILDSFEAALILAVNAGPPRPPTDPRQCTTDCGACYTPDAPEDGLQAPSFVKGGNHTRCCSQYNEPDEDGFSHLKHSTQRAYTLVERWQPHPAHQRSPWRRCHPKPRHVSCTKAPNQGHVYRSCASKMLACFSKSAGLR